MINPDTYLDQLLPTSAYSRATDGLMTGIIDRMSTVDRDLVEQALIDRLESGSEDTWIAEYLGYMKSERSLPTLYNTLANAHEAVTKIIVSSAIYNIKSDTELIKVALKAASTVHDKYALIGIFTYLAKFKDPNIERFLERFVNNEEFLISYNAKRAIKISRGESE